MSLDEVAKSVVEKGKREASQIVKEGGQEAMQVVNKAEQEAKGIVDEAVEKANRMIEVMKEQEMSSAEVEGRRNHLTAEKELLDEVKRTAFERLNAAPRSKRDEILRHLIAKAGTLIDSGSVLSNQADSEFVKRAATKYTFGGMIDCAGGIIVENAKKTVRVDLTYETILEEVWGEQIRTVADMLFK